MRLSVFGSPMPKIGPSRRSCRIDTSSDATGSSDPPPAFAGLERLPVAQTKVVDVAEIDAAVRERRIGESARETWKTRLVNEGAPAYAALANEKPLPTRDASKGLANECGDQTDSEKRKAMVNEIMTSEKVDYDTAWQRAARRSPELFK